MRTVILSASVVPIRARAGTGLLTTTALVTSLLACSLALPQAPAHAAQTSCQRDDPGEDAVPTEVDTDADADDPLLASLRLDEVHAIATGKGVGVAVVDSGVRTSEELQAQEQWIVQGPLRDGHGTIVAGLIGGAGGATGMAPDATLYDVRVSAAEPADDSSGPGGVRAADVAAAVTWASRNRDKVDVINISIGFDQESADLRHAIEEAVAQGIIVVASAGNRPADQPGSPREPEVDEQGGEGQQPEPTPDEVLFPATMPEVIAVTSRDVDLSMTSRSVLVGPQIDVSAGVVGLRSMMLRGLTCVIDQPASSWATASVSGLVALLVEEFPRDTPAQIRTRLEVTAQGGFPDSSMDGHGMIQPRAALTRPIDMTPDGTVVTARIEGREDYIAPEPHVVRDRYAEQRRSLLWWGMGAGGLLLLALVLRPLLARRR